MPGPQDFMAPVPSLRVDTAPLIALGGTLANAPQNFAKGWESGTNIALQRALADPKDYTDEKGNIDWNKLVKLGAQKGGLPFVEKLAPYVYMSGSNLPQSGGGTTQHLLNPYGAADQPPSPGGDATAQAAGPDHIDPARGASTQPKFAGSGTKEDPFELRNEGGVKFFNASQKYPEGTWYTVGGYKGQKGGAAPVSTGAGPTPPLGKVSPVAKAVSPQIQEAAGQAPDAPASSGDMAAARQRLAQGMTAAGMTPAQPQPAAIPPTATATPPQAAGLALQPGLPAIPPYSPVVRPPLPAYDPVASDPQIAANERRIGALREQASIERNKPKVLGRENAAADLEAQAAHLQEQNAKRAETLRKPYEKLNEALAQGFRTTQEKEAFEDATKKASEAGYRQLEAINAGAIQNGQAVDPEIQAGKDLLNSGKLLTGWGAETALDFNRIKQYFGQPHAAAAQEAFQKTVAAMQLGNANMQRVLAAMGGQQGGANRLFAAQINLIGQASASLTNTLAGNRILMEKAERQGRVIDDIHQMATKYLKAGHPYLDQGFNNLVTTYLKNNPLMSDFEAKDPAKFLAAPQVPKDIAKQGGAALEKWQHDVGLKPGDPVRRPPGTWDLKKPETQYFKALTPKKQENQGTGQRGPMIEVPVPMGR